MSEVQSVTIFITREPFVDFFILHIPKPDGTVHTEELEPDETVEWFRQRGGDMVLVEKTLDMAGISTRVPLRS